MEQITLILFYFAVGPLLMLVGLWHFSTHRKTGSFDWPALVAVGVGLLQLAVAYFMSGSLGLGQPGVSIIAAITLLVMLCLLLVRKTRIAHNLPIWLAIIGLLSLVIQVVMIQVHQQQTVDDAWKTIRDKANEIRP